MLKLHAGAEGLKRTGGACTRGCWRSGERQHGRRIHARGRGYAVCVTRRHFGSGRDGGGHGGGGCPPAVEDGVDLCGREVGGEVLEDEGPRRALAASTRPDQPDLVVLRQPHTVALADLLHVDVSAIRGGVLEPDFERTLVVLIEEHLVAQLHERYAAMHRRYGVVRDLLVTAVLSPDQGLWRAQVDLAVGLGLLAPYGEQARPADRRRHHVGLEAGRMSERPRRYRRPSGVRRQRLSPG